jgi:hypothetical protein
MPLAQHHLDERLADAAHRRRQRLLDREVQHRLLVGGQRQGTLPQTADGVGHRQRAGRGGARAVTVDADGGDEADALLVAAPDLGPQHPGSDHAHVAVELEATEGRAEAAGNDHEGLLAGTERQ